MTPPRPTIPLRLAPGLPWLALDQPIDQCGATARLLEQHLWRMLRQRQGEPTPWGWGWKRYRLN